MPLTPAEKQRAYRERQRAEGELPERDVNVEPTEPASRSLGISLEDYLAYELAATLAFSKSIGEDRELRRERMKRSERYLRWRYRGVLDGRVASL